MAVTIRGRAAETQNHHIRPVAADHPDDIGEHRLMPPLGDGFVRGLRKTEIDGPREELLRAVDAPRVLQLLRTNQTQRRALLRSQHVLSAFPARHG